MAYSNFMLKERSVSNIKLDAFELGKVYLTQMSRIVYFF